MKKFIKPFSIFAFAIMAALSCLTFSGCLSNAEISDDYIMISQGVYGDGKVVQEFHFSLNTQNLKKLGLQTDEIENGKKQLLSNIEIFREEFVMNFALLYQQAEEKKPQFALGNDLQISKTEYNSDLDNIGFSIVYENQEVWKFYNQKQNEETDETQDEQGIKFIIKETFSSTFPFAQEVQTSQGKLTVAQRYKEAYLKAFENAKVKVNYQPEYVYNYATSYNKIKSNSDMKFVDSQGLYHHVWTRSEGDLAKAEIQLSISTPQREWWYLTVLAVVVLGTGVSILVAFLIKKKKIFQEIK